MTIIIVLITISLSIALLFLGIFYWNMKSGQYDDTYTPSVRMLFDNQAPQKKKRPETGEETRHAKHHKSWDGASRKESRNSGMAQL